MNTHSNLFIKKLALLLCIVVLGGNFPVPVYGQEVELPRALETIYNIGLPVTTDSVCDIVPPVTTDGAYDVLPEVTTSSVYTFLRPDKEAVQQGKEEVVTFELEVGALENVNVFEIVLEYDTKQITYIEEEILLENSIMIEKKVEDGIIHLNFGTTGIQRLKEGQKIIKIQFKTQPILKEGEEVKVALKRCDFVTINEADETKVYNGVAEPQIVTLKVIKENIIADLNKDGTVTLEDLSIALKYYGIDQEHVLWEQAQKCDVIEDGVIDIADLVEISAKRSDKE